MPAEAFRLGSDGIYRCEAFGQFTWLTHGFGTRLASPPAIVTLRQIHSTIVRNAAGLADRTNDGDALLTDEPDLSIGVRTADCVPILLLDARTHAVGAVHAGWRGAAGNIVQAAIERMIDDFGTSATNLHAAIGPCIRQCCYRVGPDVAQRFSPWFPELATAREPQHLNLAEANRHQMIACGLPATQIFDSQLCTSCAIESLFSYRREPENPGRMTAAICRLR